MTHQTRCTYSFETANLYWWFYTNDLWNNFPVLIILAVGLFRFCVCVFSLLILFRCSVGKLFLLEFASNTNSIRFLIFVKNITSDALILSSTRSLLGLQLSGMFSFLTTHSPHHSFRYEPQDIPLAWYCGGRWFIPRFLPTYSN